jgi:hypothetical protein
VSCAYRYRPAGGVGTSGVAVLKDPDMTSTRGSVLLARRDRGLDLGGVHGSAAPWLGSS